MSEQSEQINDLATALAKAQGKITGALKDSANPFFKSKYADLASVWDACRAALSENGLAVIQFPEADDSGLFVVTTLTHASGQWMRSRLRLTPKDDSPQAAGSAITYGRRYALASAVGVAQVDDDGNAASGKDADNRPKPQDQAAVNKYAGLLTDALNADIEDPARAKMIYNLRQELNGKQDLMDAIWEKLESKQKRAIKLYIDQHVKAIAMGEKQ